MPCAKGTCFRLYTQMRVQKKPKHLRIEFIVTSHNSAGQKGNKSKKITIFELFFFCQFLTYFDIFFANQIQQMKRSAKQFHQWNAEMPLKPNTQLS